MFNAPSPFSVIAGRAQRALDALQSRIQSGQLTLQTDLLAGVIDTVTKFADSLRAPSLVAPTMQRDDLLLLQNLTDPLQQADEDLQLAHLQLETTRQLTQQVFNVSAGERLGLGDLLAQATALVDSYRLWITDSDPTFVWVGDSFNDHSKLDASSTVFTDARAGTVTLSPISAQPLNPYVTAITLDKALSKGGLPGNNMEIADPGPTAVTAEAPQPQPIRFHDRKPKTDSLPAVLDGKPDTWFEWERNYIDLPQTILQTGYALVYDPAGAPTADLPKLPNWTCYLRWPGENGVDRGDELVTQKTVKGKAAIRGTRIVQPVTKSTQITESGYPLASLSANRLRVPLYLAINLTLDQPRSVSWLQLTPLIKGSAYPQVEQVWISADGNHWRKLLSTPTVLNPRLNRGVDFSQIGAAASNFEGVGVWPFPSTPVQYVQIILSQAAANTTAMSLGAAHPFFTAPVRTKVKGPSLFSHSKYANVTKRVVGPVPILGDGAAAPDGVAPVDFAGSTADAVGQATAQFDVFQGERQVIAIRDILLEQRVYAESGQLVSAAYALSQPARAVSLITTESVPTEWPRLTPDGKPWISYELSSDGQTWRPIVPQQAQLSDSVVSFDPPATSLQLRATLTRPAEQAAQSPVLLAYALKVLPSA